ncbi:MAG: fimbrial assembly protein [Nitrococcus sp.]|nr:fimbrial assembly protein [Nitrococcus sp.]
MLGRDHKLYYEAYNDASDLNGDGQIDVGYKPTEIDYYGYFDSFTCYSYDATNGRFTPVSATGTNKTCSGTNGDEWSGDFLNYLTTARIDALRKVLYGGKRVLDSMSTTVLERTHIPQDAHSWGKEYTSTTVDGFAIESYSPLSQPSAGTRHLFANTTLNSYNDPPLLRVLNDSQFRVWEWVGKNAPVAGSECVDTGSFTRLPCETGSSTIQDYTVRVEVCLSGLLEANCRAYTDSNGQTVYKPTGLLHEYGANDQILFGLLSGSYKKNTSGGVLRKNIGSFTDEFDPANGIFTAFNSLNGIVETIDTLRTVGFNYGSRSYNCGWITNRAITDADNCAMWGNPIAEMMYEGVRYFAGKGSATSAFAVSTPELGLPAPNWQDPYASGSDASNAGAEYCSKPFQLVISDINPSYDSDQLPGSYFDSFGGLAGLNVQTEADTITANEPDFPGTYYIGQVGGNATGAPTPKTVSDLGEIRGLAPEEPTKQGSYYSASVAYYAHRQDINATVQNQQSMDTFAVALASPLPHIKIDVNGNTVTLIPFAKSVWGPSGYVISPITSEFQPTDQIVDFYVDTIVNVSGFPTDSTVNGGRPYYKFRINFEDVEQGADHDMDAIATYTIKETADSKVEITLESKYASGSIIQHMGYVISGVTQSGTYLEIRDVPDGGDPDVDFHLDTPEGVWAGDFGNGWDDDSELPQTHTRVFTPDGTTGAQLLNDPLWYAAKWGGFQDKDSDDLPDPLEWDENSDGAPDNYFLVTNAGQLGAQLEAAFQEILARVSSATSVAIESGSIASASQVYLARFDSGDWTGSLVAYALSSSGDIGAANWDAACALTGGICATDGKTYTAPDPITGRRIVTYDPTATPPAGVPFKWSSLSNSQQNILTSFGLDQDRVAYLRGDRSKEQSNGGSFRNRTGLLGDVVHSTPVYVGPPDRFYPDGLATTNYSAFKSAHSSREGVVYVGANDGMLHAFAADNGEELFAYVPSAVYDHLSDLTNPGYGHRFYVDGTPTEGDAFFNGAWQTVLVGGLRAGGQGIYALDITDVPSASTSETTIASRVLWEFTDADDADLGYTYSRPQIVRLHNDKWAAVFGNGYNSTDTGPEDSISGDGDAVLYVVDIADGSLIAEIDTTIGSTTAPNGLATVTPADIDGDSIVDYVYAGDLYGNLWKFDLRSTTPNNWEVAHGKPIFQAVGPSGTAQPITTRPSLRRHPTGDGFLVMFGTGKYLEPTDATADPSVIQSVYGIWDRDLKDDNTGNLKPFTSFTRDHLLEQTIEDEIAQNGSEWRVLSNNTMQWYSETGLPTPDPTTDSTSDADSVPDNDDYYLGWYLDLKVQNEAAAGEMQVTDTLVRGNRLIFTTLIPNDEPCSAGGDSWLMVLDFRNGGRFTFSPFDVDNNGVFDLDDLVTININGETKEVSLNGRKSKGGVLQKPALGSLDDADRAYLGGSDGGGTDCAGEDCVDLNRDPALLNRQSWRQLR